MKNTKLLSAHKFHKNGKNWFEYFSNWTKHGAENLIYTNSNGARFLFIILYNRSSSGVFHQRKKIEWKITRTLMKFFHCHNLSLFPVSIKNVRYSWQNNFNQLQFSFLYLYIFNEPGEIYWNFELKFQIHSSSGSGSEREDYRFVNLLILVSSFCLKKGEGSG